VVTAACFLFCRRATGAASARPSLRPHFSKRAAMSRTTRAKGAAGAKAHVRCVMSRRCPSERPA
jgi:hypothetical protein